MTDELTTRRARIEALEAEVERLKMRGIAQDEVNEQVRLLAEKLYTLAQQTEERVVALEAGA
jgi:hypothetical protein